MTKHHVQSGFSLVEALVAMALLAMVSTAAIMIFSGFLAGGDGQQRRIDKLATMMRARALLADDLAHGIIRPHGPATSQAVFGGDARKTCFLTFARRNALAAQFDDSRSDIESLSYCLIGDRLVRRSWSRPNAALETAKRDIVLLTDIGTLTTRYYDGKNWQTEWFIGHVDGRFYGQDKTLPRLVEVSWQSENGNKNAKFTHMFRLSPGGYP